jgi:methionine-rich copper-binding protein CopC
MIRVHTFAALLVALALAQPSFAHTTLESSTPANGATLEQSPPVIEMKFHHPINLTSVVVVDASKAGRKMDFSPHASAAVFKVENPQLVPGKNELTWKGLSSDGHVVSGSLVFQVKAKEPKAP